MVRLPGGVNPQTAPPPDRGGDDEERDALGRTLDERGHIPQPNQGANTPITVKDIEDFRMDMNTEAQRAGSNYAVAQGLPSWAYKTTIDQVIDQMVTYLMPITAPWAQGDQRINANAIPGRTQTADPGIFAFGANAVDNLSPIVEGKYNPNNPEALQALLENGLMWLDSNVLPGVFNHYMADNYSTSSSRSGGGTRKPTAGEIRANFDIDALARKAQEMARAYMVEDIPNARSLATQYVDAIVATGGEQDIEFNNFILSRFEQTSRWKTIHRNRPDGVDPLEYIRPYAQAALGALGGNRGKGIGDVAGQGATLGASAATFNARLLHEEAVQNTSGFMSKVGEKLGSVKGILGG